MTEDQEFHRDRRFHGGAPQHLDDDKLAELTEEERVDAGLDAYDPDEVPPATDPLPDNVPAAKPDIRDTPEYQEERREAAQEQPGEDGFPPTRYKQ
jgi:hypothetical protein